LRLIAISAGFVALGAWMVSGAVDESSSYSPALLHLIGWANVVFFGLIGLKMLAGLLRPTRVVLTPAGFQIKELLTKPLVRWGDVDQFFIAQVLRTKFVCYELRPGLKSSLEKVWHSQRPQWGDGQMPTLLELEPEQVRDVLIEWRDRYSELRGAADA
jgi:hypothetical protein